MRARLKMHAANIGASIQPVRIDRARSQQYFEGWGTSLCWFANVRYPEGVRQRLFDLLFDPGQGLGLEIVRYNIRGVDPGSPDAGNLPVPRLIAEAFSNSPPFWMTVSGRSMGHHDPKCDNLAPANYDNFVHYLTEGSQRTHLRDMVKPTGKRLWVSGYGCGSHPSDDIQSGLDLSRCILADLNTLQANAWVYWQAVENSPNFWGLITIPFANPTGSALTIGKQYYAMASTAGSSDRGLPSWELTTQTARLLRC
ncbi:hypothetical protein WJX72_009728 [[Myrmecia] bisecta]|uniref:Uncharacterized protein n=1 Tax=[Myrmecia] bisecta TaxID=41462 RepID=A0AAW1Q9Z5_9CHLO